MRLAKWIPIGSALLLAALLPGVGWAQNQNQNSRPAQPGSINYVEGQASFDSHELSPSSAGSTQLQAGQSLTTQTGKVEVLLVPGTFLRVDDNSSVKMVNPGLANTEVEIDKGRAMLEATDINKNNDIRVDENGVTTRILKNGLYDFDANQNTIRVFNGKAEVLLNDKKIGLGKERELILNAGAKTKAQDFDARNYEDDFFRWSALRSGYLSEASVDQARIYVNGGPGWFGPGWYWDPGFQCYTFIPGAGIFYSPFGWGFYSPWLVYQAPFYGYGYGRYYHHFATNYHNWGPGPHYVEGKHYANGIYHGPGAVRGFHSGPRMATRSVGGFGRGGVQGRAGGFHGAGGGGFHGGGGLRER